MESTPSDLRTLERRESTALVILATLAVLAALYETRAIMLPMTFSVIVALTLRPVVRKFRRWGVPDVLGAGLTLFVLIAILALGAANLLGPGRDWVRGMPEKVTLLKEKIHSLHAHFKDLSETTSRVEELTESKSNRQPVPVQITQSSLSTNVSILSNTGNAIASVLLVLCLAFFLLACGDRLINNVLHLLETWSDKKRTVELIYDVERGINSYLLTVTAINVGLGIATTLVMWLLGLPNAPLWGLMATVFNYIPIFGAIAGFVVLLLVSLLSFESMLYALVPPLAFCALTTIEGNLITPSILGKSMSLNPILVFVALIFWGWIWGVGGAFLAVPMLAIAKLAFERFERTRPIAVLMEG